MIKTINLFLFFIFLSSCSHYVSQMHRSFDAADGRSPERSRDRFDQYRKKKDYEDKQTMNSLRNPYVVPSTRREYRPMAVTKKRYRADDLTDNRGDGSLWSGVEGRDNFLFTNNEEKRNGDIVLIQVADKLKNEITAELKRAFPSPMVTTKKPTKAPASAPAPAQSAAPNGGEDKEETKIHDRISGVVIEQINRDHVLIRGRKSLLYKNRKRLVEVQALVARRDIESDDTVNSDRIVETTINVLR